MEEHPNKPHRLHQLFQPYHPAIYFITFNTHRRIPILNNDAVHLRFRSFANQSVKHGVAFGRYVIMPDHIHVFIRIMPDLKIGTTIRLLKRSLSTSITQPMPHWQPGFFDHVLRHSESYAEKWAYVYQNPVRAGLVGKPEEWPFQGQIIPIRY